MRVTSDTSWSRILTIQGLIVVSEWESRAATDRVLAEYADNDNAKRANALAAEPRRWTVGRAITD